MESLHAFNDSFRQYDYASRALLALGLMLTTAAYLHTVVRRMPPARAILAVLPLLVLNTWIPLMFDSRTELLSRLVSCRGTAVVVLSCGHTSLSQAAADDATAARLIHADVWASLVCLVQVLSLLSFWLGNFKVSEHATAAQQADTPSHPRLHGGPMPTAYCLQAAVKLVCSPPGATVCLHTDAQPPCCVQAVGLCLNRGPIAGNNWNLAQVCLLYMGPIYPRQGEQPQCRPSNSRPSCTAIDQHTEAVSRKMGATAVISLLPTAVFVCWHVPVCRRACQERPPDRFCWPHKQALLPGSSTRRCWSLTQQQLFQDLSCLWHKACDDDPCSSGFCMFDRHCASSRS